MKRDATLADLRVQVIRPIGAEGLNRRRPAGPCRLFLGPGFRLGARWNRLGGTVKTRKKRGKTGKKRARYGLKRVNKEGTGGINWWCLGCFLPTAAVGSSRAGAWFHAQGGLCSGRQVDHGNNRPHLGNTGLLSPAALCWCWQATGAPPPRLAQAMACSSRRTTHREASSSARTTACHRPVGIGTRAAPSSTHAAGPTRKTAILS